MKNEKSELPVTATGAAMATRKPLSRRFTMLALSLTGLMFGIDGLLKIHHRSCGGSLDGLRDVFVAATDYSPVAIFDQDAPELCPQVDQVLPVKHKALWEDIGALYSSEFFKPKAAEYLGGAVRIP